MHLKKIEKQKLLSEPLSKDAQRIARAIYNTYAQNENDLYLEIHLSIVYKLLNIDPDDPNSLPYLRELLKEINEPLAVKNFEYKRVTYPVRYVNFFDFQFDGDTLQIELHEEFLHVLKYYMLDTFL